MASAWPRLARCLYRLNRLTDAAEIFAQADSLSGLTPGDLIMWARTLHASGRPELALQAAQRGVTGGNGDAEALYLCGITLQELGQFDEAEAALRRAFDMEPQRTESIEALAAMGRTRSEDAGLLEALLDADSEMSPAARASAGFALYRIHDRNDDLETAFASLTRANEIKAAIEPFDAAAHRTTIDGMLKAFDAGFFQQLKPVTWTPGFTPIFILGMPRAGTTLAEQILAHYPQVHAGGERIPFGQVLSEAFDDMGAVAGRGRNWAEQQARLIAEHLSQGSNDAGFVTDKTPGNYMALPFIAWMFPTARVILCRRDPRDVGFSCYEQNFRRGATFAYRLDAFACAWQGFADITRHWQEVSPLEVFQLTYRSLVRNPDTVGKQLVEFCGLPWTPDCLDTTRTGNAIQTASFWQARQPINTRSIGRWRRYERYFGDVLAMLGPVDES